MRATPGPSTGRLRHDPKLAQAAQAARLQLAGWDIDRAGVAKIEIGLREVRDRELVRLAKALDVSACWLLGQEGDQRRGGDLADAQAMEAVKPYHRKERLSNIQ